MKGFFFTLALMFSPLFSAPSVRVHVQKDHESVGSYAYSLFIQELNLAKSKDLIPVFIFPTGSTPEPFYRTLVDHFFEGKVDLSRAVFFNMDEYVGLSKDHPQSYWAYMERALYSYIRPGMNETKLNYFGLRPLTKKECSNTKHRTRLNEAIKAFGEALLTKSGPLSNLTDSVEEVAEEMRVASRAFKRLEQEFMNDKVLPSLASLKSLFEKEVSLRSFCPQSKNIHRLVGNAPDLEKETKKYRDTLRSYLDSEKAWVCTFGGIGVQPAHIAFNDFITEDLFLQEHVSEEEKNRLAMQSETRLIPLSCGTKKSNSRFFEEDESRVPSQALTIGFKEIFLSDRIIIMANGKTKKSALYHTFCHDPSYHTPASLLRKYNKGQLSFVLDQESYGLGEPNSLFSLNILNPKSLGALSCDTSEKNSVSFWDLPLRLKPALLDTGQKEKDDKIAYSSLPKGKKILWVKHGKLSPTLCSRLKQNKNQVEVVRAKDVLELSTHILRSKPDVIALPYTRQFASAVKKLSSILRSQAPEKPVLGIFYDVGASYNNVHLPLKRADVKKKIYALSEFHKTQCKRSKFDQIALEMSRGHHPNSPYMESFVFFKLGKKNGRWHRIPFPKDTLIEKGKPKRGSFSFKPSDLVVAVAPHPDDLEIGMGAALNHLGNKNVPVLLLGATSGHRAVIEKQVLADHPHMPDDVIALAQSSASEYIEDNELKAKSRAIETQKALQYLHPTSQVLSMDLPFYDLGYFSEKDRDAIDAVYKKHFEDSERLIVFLPHPQDQHQTHQKTHHIFKERLLKYLDAYPKKSVILAYYSTTWTGNWNLYEYSSNKGSKFSALVGAEQLVGHGRAPANPNLLGGSQARRYRLFYFK